MDSLTALKWGKEEGEVSHLITLYVSYAWIIATLHYKKTRSDLIYTYLFAYFNRIDFYLYFPSPPWGYTCHFQFQFLTNIPFILSNIILSRIERESLPNIFQNIAHISKIPIFFKIENQFYVGLHYLIDYRTLSNVHLCQAPQFAHCWRPSRSHKSIQYRCPICTSSWR